MQSFKDAEGRQWMICVDPISIDLVQANQKVDLFEVEKPLGLDNPQDAIEWQLVGRPILFCRVMWDLLTERPDDVSFEDFARALRGEALAAARDALWESIVNFIPDPDERRVRKEGSVASTRCHYSLSSEIGS